MLVNLANSRALLGAPSAPDATVSTSSTQISAASVAPIRISGSLIKLLPYFLRLPLDGFRTGLIDFAGCLRAGAWSPQIPVVGGCICGCGGWPLTRDLVFMQRQRTPQAHSAGSPASFLDTGYQVQSCLSTPEVTLARYSSSNNGTSHVLTR